MRAYVLLFESQMLSQPVSWQPAESSVLYSTRTLVMLPTTAAHRVSHPPSTHAFPPKGRMM
jgi:hypothetical protein